MDPRHLPRRRAYLSDIPKNVGIPKFLRPEEILRVKSMKDSEPWMSWDEVVSLVVFDSVNIPELFASP